MDPFEIDENGMCNNPDCPNCPRRRSASLAAPPHVMNALPGIGGAPSRATTLPTDSTQRKDYPIATGFMDYFPDAIVELSRLSKLANDQHNPDKPMHWDRSKSQNEDDTMMRHFLQRGTRDTDGTRHSTRMAWRALAFLQKEIEGEKQ